jgi:hypothetical protein
MFRKLKLLFSRKDTKISISPSSAPVIEKKAVTEYFQEELDSCPFIKKECHNIVMKHLSHEVSLVKTDNKLTAEEKKEIGLNPRQAITKELVAVLTKEGLRNKNPKGILADIYNKATITKLRDDGFSKSIGAGIKKFTLQSSGDGSECDWCKENIDIEMGQDILELIKINCTCHPYSKCFIKPIVDF